MKVIFICRSLCWSTCLSMTAISALGFSEESVLKEQGKAKPTVEEVSLCTKETLMTFFPQPIVKSVLIENGVPEDQALFISKELAQKDQEIVKTVETKASQLDPNPFKELSQRNVAVKIFRETLYEVFSDSLKKQGVTDEAKVHALLETIQEIKGKLFVECIRREGTKKEKG